MNSHFIRKITIKCGGELARAAIDFVMQFFNFAVAGGHEQERVIELLQVGRLDDDLKSLRAGGLQPDLRRVIR